MKNVIQVNVSIPAIDNLVAYWREQDKEAQQLTALGQRIVDATKQVEASGPDEQK